MSNATESRCPRCQVPLFAGRAPDTTLYGCGRCGGIWLDIEGSRTAVQGLSGEAVELVKRVTMAATADADVSATGIPCPTCGKPMQRNAASGVPVDLCPEHGTWFDRHELYKVVQEAERRKAPPPAPVQQFYAPSMTAHGGGYSTWAIVGFVLSFFCGLAGLVCSIIGYKECDNSGGVIQGKGLATAGIIISILSMLLGIISVIGR